MSELRWILLAAGLIALALIYWQGRRRRVASDSQRAREFEPPQLNESAVVRRREHAIPPQESVLPIDDLPEVRIAPSTSTAPPLVKLSMEDALSTAALDRLTITQPLNPAPAPKPQTTSTPAVDRSPSVPRPAATATAPRVARKIIALRVPATAQLFDGARLKESFAALGLRHGRYGIFHRTDPQGLPIFSVASIIEPGTFDPAQMAQERYPGLSLFLQLPGPSDGIMAFNAMLDCARSLQQEFQGALQGERGKPLTDEVVERMREDITDFQHLMRPASTNA